VKHIVKVPWRAAVAVTVVVASFGALATAVSAGAQGSVRGFDGTTIKVGSMGIKGSLPLASLGAQARIKRFNDTKEIKGVKIQYTDYADDKQDPAVALSEARRLVTEDQVFAIVGDASANNPVSYFAQQHVPYFGGGFDYTYCSHTPSTKLWGFSIQGCIQPSNPSFVGDFFKAPLQYVQKASGKKRPTIVLFGANTDSGKTGLKFLAVSAKGAGFNVVGVQNTIPAPPPSDYTPYVQKMITADHGGPPDSIICEMTVECVTVWDQLKATGYKGKYISGLLADELVKILSGSAANGPYVYFTTSSPNMDRMKADIEAVGGSASKINYGALMGYTSTDMFIQALKTVAKKGKSNITPENVRKAASTQTWKFDGVMGATQYPKTTVFSYPSCLAVYESNGTAWQTAVPLICSTKTYSPNLKVPSS
jgi:ABC-type branched-subunit amino acid transport system substrate-binding protein